MFDAIAQNYGVGNPQQVTAGSSSIPAWMQTGGPSTNDGTLNTQGTTQLNASGNLPFTSIDPRTLAALGWTGGNPIVSQAGSGGNQDTGPTPSSNTFSPEFLQFLAQKGITPSLTSGVGNSTDLGFYTGNSTGEGRGLIGVNQNANLGSDKGWMTIGSLLLAGAGGLAAAGAGAGVGAAEGAAGAAGGGGAGLSSADLAALYGDAGYGATGAGDAAIGGGALAGDEGGTALGAEVGGNALEDTSGTFANLGDEALPGSTDLAAAGGGGTFGAGDTGGLGAGATGGATSPGFASSIASGDYGGALDAAGNFITTPTGASLIGGIANGLLGASAASKASNAQTTAANNALALQKTEYDTTRADQAPYRAAGSAGVAGMTNLLANPGSITSDPSYAFGLSQGQTAVDHSAASTGSLYSGATLKALQRYGQDYAGTKLNDAFGRYSTAANLGEAATTGTSAAGANYANNGGTDITGAGNAQAGADLYTNSVLQNAINNSLATYNRSTYGPVTKTGP